MEKALIFLFFLVSFSMCKKNDSSAVKYVETPKQKAENFEVMMGTRFPKEAFAGGKVPNDIDAWLKADRILFLNYIKSGKNPGKIPTRTKSIPNMNTVVISDVHGSILPLINLLKSSRLIERYDGFQTKWSGGKSTLVFNGDFRDRGPWDFQALSLLVGLQQQAKSHGGRVFLLYGNHEFMSLSKNYQDFHPQAMTNWIIEPLSEQKKAAFKLNELLSSCRFELIEEFREQGFPIADFVASRVNELKEFVKNSRYAQNVIRSIKLSNPTFNSRKKEILEGMIAGQNVELNENFSLLIGGWASAISSMHLNPLLDQSFASKSVWARFFSSHFKVGLIIDKSTFVHGGFVDDFLNYRTSGKNSTIFSSVKSKIGGKISEFESFVKKLNIEMDQWLLRGGESPLFLTNNLKGERGGRKASIGPLWSREVSTTDVESCEHTQLLPAFGIKRMFVGHQPQSRGVNRLKCKKNGFEIVRVDHRVFTLGNRFTPLTDKVNVQPVIMRDDEVYVKYTTMSRQVEIPTTEIP